MLTLNDGRSELWQWDTGRKLTVDADCSQVHFSNKVFGRSIDIDVADGVAIIPDILLQTDKDLNVWAFVGTADNGYTKISKTFKVNRRNKPADYVFTPTDQMTLQTIQSQIGDLADLNTEAKDNLVAAVNEAMEKGGGEVDPEAVQQIVNDYLAANPPSVTETDPTVPAWAKAAEKPAYTAAEVGADLSGTAEAKVAAHNTRPDTHRDIRLLISGLTGRLNALADSDDTTLDQLSEVVAYIKSNRTLIEAITTDKVSVSDVIDNLTSNVSNKPLSAAQGVALKGLIDAISIPDKLPNPNALTFTGAATGTYDGAEPLTVNIPSSGGGSAEPGYKDSATILDVTLDAETGGLKKYEYDVSGVEKTDVIIINILFPESYTGIIYVKDQNDARLADVYPSSAKGILIGLKSMNGRYMHSCVHSGNTAARLEAPLSLFYGQLSGASGFERPKAPDTIAKLKFVSTSEFVSGTRIRAYRW